MSTIASYPTTSFGAALAAAKPGDALKVPADRYTAKIVGASVKAGSSSPILRLDLDIVSGRSTATKFAGRRMIKNQPLSIAAAGYVAALLEQCEMSDVRESPSTCEALAAGDEAVVRRFVGKTIVVDRSYVKDSDEVKMELVVEDSAQA